MNRQEVFDKVWAHAAQMTCKSEVEVFEDDVQCRYRGDDGNKCFIGALIPDDLYSPDLEGECAAHLSNDIYEHLGVDDDFSDAIDFLGELQSVHDFHPIDQWDDQLRAVAARFNLTAPEAPLRSAA